MRIGELNKRIDIQAPTKISDSMGGFTVSWSTMASQIAAAIWPVSANEQIKAGQVSMTVTHRIRIRYRNMLKASWRISWGGRYFNIVSLIDANMAHEYLDLLCKEESG